MYEVQIYDMKGGLVAVQSFNDIDSAKTCCELYAYSPNLIADIHGYSCAEFI